MRAARGEHNSTLWLDVIKQAIDQHEVPQAIGRERLFIAFRAVLDRPHELRARIEQQGLQGGDGTIAHNLLYSLCSRGHGRQ